jgi:hypothetical protein
MRKTLSLFSIALALSSNAFATRDTNIKSAALTNTAVKQPYSSVPATPQISVTKVVTPPPAPITMGSGPALCGLKTGKCAK